MVPVPVEIGGGTEVVGGKVVVMTSVQGLRKLAKRKKINTEGRAVVRMIHTSQ